MFEFTEKEIIRENPAIREIKLPARRTYNWMLIQMGPLKWWKTMSGRMYDRVWTIEDDTDYCGDIHDLIDKYENLHPDADLVSRSLVKSEKSWPHFNRMTKNFTSILQGSDRFVSCEHVQRFSAQLFDLMLNMTEAGALSAGEQFAPSLCMKKWDGGFDCKFQDIHDEDIGPEFSWNSSVSQMELSKFCNSSQGRGRLFHAMKW